MGEMGPGCWSWSALPAGCLWAPRPGKRRGHQSRRQSAGAGCLAYRALGLGDKGAEAAGRESPRVQCDVAQQLPPPHWVITPWRACLLLAACEACTSQPLPALLPRPAAGLLFPPSCHSGASLRPSACTPLPHASAPRPQPALSPPSASYLVCCLASARLPLRLSSGLAVHPTLQHPASVRRVPEPGPGRCPRCRGATCVGASAGPAGLSRT